MTKEEIIGKYKPNGEYPSYYHESNIEQMLDEAYNMGIDHAIKATEIERDSYYSKNTHNIALLRAKALHNNVISKLEALKKPIS